MIARAFDGKPEGLTRDDVLDNVTLYWLTNTAISSARLYWDTAHNLPAGGFFDVRGIKIPVAVSAFAEEIYQAPKSWAEKAYPKLIHYNSIPQGHAFCGLGTAEAVCGRDARQLQITAQFDLTFGGWRAHFARAAFLSPEPQANGPFRSPKECSCVLTVQSGEHMRPRGGTRHESKQARACRGARQRGRGFDRDFSRGQEHDAQDGASHGIAPAKVQPVAAGELSSLSSATEWLNSPSLTADNLRGKVVLIDFWTYTCINWLRTVPYVRAWAEKYKDQGLVVIGVHAPEFAFERNIDNVRQAAKRHERRLSHRRRQRLCDMASFRQRSLASSLSRRCAGSHAVSSFRRGPVRAVGEVHSKTTCGSWSQRHQSRAGFGQWCWCRSGRRLGQLEVAGKLFGL